MFPLSFLISSLLLCVGLLLRYKQRISRRLRLPPGPKGYPLIGNVYDIPHSYAWLKYSEWSKQYGDVIKVNAIGTVTIILHSWEAAIELLDKRASNYSDRPRMIMASELAGWDWDFAHMPYSDRWRRHRRKFHQHFQPRNISAYHNIQQILALNFLDQLLHSPDRFDNHIRQFVGSVALRAAYGYQVKGGNDYYIKLVHDALQPLLHIVHAGIYLVEYLPFLKHIPKWFPGAGFKRDAQKWAIETEKMRQIPYQAVKKSMEDGTLQKSFVNDSLYKIKSTDGEVNPDEEEVIKNCAAMIYIAGSDTTASLIHTWFLAMARYPEVQRKAQAEIDSVVGRSRMPDFNDKPSTPYIDAMILETMRWSPITPLALPHRAVSEDEYQGYRIPAGAAITVNVWHIMHDEKLYPDSFNFKPERFLPKDGTTAPEIDPILVGAFGFGRRICPGRHLAMTSAWIAVASILANFDISKCIDSDGKVIEPTGEYTDGLVSHPKPFNIRITPRSERTKELIEISKLEQSL